jgi:uncharacterized protein (DUF1501 family)
MAGDVNRREFLRAGAAAVATASLPLSQLRANFNPASTADACILLMLTGGPSQLDTWDPKPDAPSDIRGAFRSIPTSVPGTQISELFPRMATLADRFSLVRTMNHDAAPIHETGFQLVNTGKLFRDGPEWPSVGCVLSYLHGDTESDPPRHYVAPWPKVETGINVGCGYGPGFLRGLVPWQGDDIGKNCGDEDAVDFFRKHGMADDRYGVNAFGVNCFGALKSVAKRPGRFITVNQFSTVFDSPSWDCHADRGSLATDLGDYRDTVAPMFDLAFSQLLIDLEDRGLLERTLVVATGEFGRTPRPNANGGRDHWPGCWTAILAGGGVRGGRIVGTSDAHAAEPKDRPVSPPELVATIYRALGVSHDATIPGPDGRPVRVVDASPIRELF